MSWCVAARLPHAQPPLDAHPAAGRAVVPVQTLRSVSRRAHRVAWQSVAAYPERLAFPACGGIDGKLYCAGGFGDAGPTAHAYAYDPATDRWRPITALPAPIWAAGYATANGRLVGSGGATASEFVMAGSAYDPGTDRWSPVPAYNQFTPVIRGAAACGFYRFGGISADNGATSTDFERLAGYDTCPPADVPAWLAAPTWVTVPAHQSVTVTLTVDGTAIAQPGTLAARLVAVSTDTPYAPAPAAVTVRATPPDGWGAISGQVTAAATCGRPAAPLDHATVQFDTGHGGHTVRSDGNGRYTLWLPEEDRGVTVLVAKDGFASRLLAARVRGGQIDTVDVVLAAHPAC